MHKYNSNDSKDNDENTEDKNYEDDSKSDSIENSVYWCFDEASE